MEEEIIEQRRKKFISSLKKNTFLITIIFLLIALVLGVYIRSLPMKSHGDNPGLWDISTDSWTLGPDLDPFLFLRYAELIVEQGKIPEIDTLRYVPLGFETSRETQLLPYLIAYTYKFLNLFMNPTIAFAGVILPVIMFGLTVIAFFLFVRELFIDFEFFEKSRRKIIANSISLISTFLMIVAPSFLSRTIAGIPEKESVSFFFMFLCFYLFLKAWKSENKKRLVIFSVLAGLSTAAMGLVWGGVIYVFVTISVSFLIGFILNKTKEKEILVYGIWFLVSLAGIFFFTDKFSLKEFISSLDTGLAFVVFFISIVHIIVLKTRLLEKESVKKKLKHHMPENFVSLGIAILIGILGVLIFFGPGFFIEKISDLNRILFKPVEGRWNITVAENRQPYFTEWVANFGPNIRNIPLMFWLFFIGSVVLFNDTIKKLDKKDKAILIILYILFFFGLVFSRYSEASLLNGENLISKLFYYGTFILFGVYLAYSYFKYSKKQENPFEKINYEIIFLFVLFVLTLFTARSAIRLIMVLGPISPIFPSYLIVSSILKLKNIKNETTRAVGLFIVVVLLFLIAYMFFVNFQIIKAQASVFIPSSYTNQWQLAMEWVRENTQGDDVFAHWWDYGYWVQSMAKRPTVTDGGNAISYWNYLVGRYVLTGDNQKQALEFLHTHNADYILIDSSDIGKYTAFSSIGSNKDYDRFSWVPIMVSSKQRNIETRNGTTRIYEGGSIIDEDILYGENETKIFLPQESSAIIGVIIEVEENNESIKLKQPNGVYYSNGKQEIIPLRYIYYNNQIFDFKKGLNATAFVIQLAQSNGNQLFLDNQGALMYLSPKMMKGLFAQLYLLNDPFDNFDAFKLVHSEDSILISSVNKQGADLNEFVYYGGGIQGPIKIWEVDYKGDEVVNPDWLLTTQPDYIDWKF